MYYFKKSVSQKFENQHCCCQHTDFLIVLKLVVDESGANPTWKDKRVLCASVDGSDGLVFRTTFGKSIPITFFDF